MNAIERVESNDRKTIDFGNKFSPSNNSNSAGSSDLGQYSMSNILGAMDRTANYYHQQVQSIGQNINPENMSDLIKFQFAVSQYTTVINAESATIKSFKDTLTAMVQRI